MNAGNLRVTVEAIIGAQAWVHPAHPWQSATKRLQRTVNPTLYSSIEIDKRILDENAFVKRVLAQPKLWVIGEGRGLAA
jgi:hypothetical protein